MAKLDAKLLGTPCVLVDGRAISLPYKKADALLYYLLRKGKVSRNEAVELLWPDADAQTALKNLRHAIYSIRKEFGWDFLRGGQRAFLELSPGIELRCDVSDFWESGDPERYGGEFLKDFSVPKTVPFEDWMIQERNLLQTRYLQCLLAVARDAFHRGDLEQASRHCLAYVEQDPLEEDAVVLLMQIYSAQQQFRKAIGLYHELCKRLSDEFGIPPMKETSSLYYRIVDEWNASTYRMEEDTDCLLLGKDQALRRLLLLCNGLSGAHRQPCVFLEGEAGVGKTYLLDHILSHYDFSDWLICRSFCYQTETGGFLAPWNSIMLELATELVLRHITIPETYIKTAGVLFPGLSPGAGGQLAASDEDYPLQASCHAAQRSVLAIFSMVAKQTPLLLIFEDVHWMDAGSAGLLALLLRRLRERDVAVICTSRDILPAHMKNFVEEGRRDGVLERCPLRSFTQEETKRFLRYYTDQTPQEELAEQIFHNTGGNALLLTQILDSLKENKTPAELPQTPEAIIGYRLATLPEDERQLLELVSVFVGWAPFDALASILHEDTLSLTYLCHQLTQKKLLVESTQNGSLEYAFVHERIKSIVSGRQSESGRRLLHLRLAQFLETELERGGSPSYDRLCHHYTEGGDHLKAFCYKILSMNVYAGLFYELLPTLAADSEMDNRGKDGLADYFHTLEAELADLRRFAAEENVQELDRLELTLLHTESRFCIHDGLYPRGLELLHQLLNCCDAMGEENMAFQAHLQFVYYGIQTGNKAVMEHHLSIGRALLEGKEHSAEYGVYLRLLGLLRLMQGEYPQARKIMGQSIQAFQALDSDMDGRYAINIAGAYNYMAETYRLEGRYSEAFHCYDQAIAYNRSRGYYPGAAVIYTNYGVAAYQNGQRSEARKLFRYAVDIYTDSHEYSGYPIALSYLALYDAQEGRFDRAAQQLKDALRLSETIASPWWKGITLYMAWKIRCFMEERGQTDGELESFWPASKEDHCRQCLSCLHQLQPRIETEEMERDLKRISGEP